MSYASSSSSSSSSYSSPSARPALVSGSLIRSWAYPLLLCSILTSFSFHAASARAQHADQQRRWEIQREILMGELHRLEKRQAHASGSPSLGALTLIGARTPTSSDDDDDDDRRDAALARRCLRVSLDPSRLGVPPRLLPRSNEVIDPDGAVSSSITWTQVLFGTSAWPRIKDSFSKAAKGAAEGVRASFATRPYTTPDDPSQQENGSAASNEWESAIVAYAHQLEEKERQAQVDAAQRAQAQSVAEQMRRREERQRVVYPLSAPEQIGRESQGEARTEQNVAASSASSLEGQGRHSDRTEGGAAVATHPQTQQQRQRRFYI